MNARIMDPDIETASRRAVERLQAQRLAGRVAWAYERSGFFIARISTRREFAQPTSNLATTCAGFP